MSVCLSVRLSYQFFNVTDISGLPVPTLLHSNVLPPVLSLPLHPGHLSSVQLCLPASYLLSLQYLFGLLLHAIRWANHDHMINRY